MSQADVHLTGSAATQSELWGRAARDWAGIQEGQVRPLYESVLDRLDVGNGTTLLDIGCGAGMACMLAAKRGAEVAGFDATAELLEIARDRTPTADFRQGDQEHLPHEADSFDVVTGFNSFQFAADPVAALREAKRVTTPGGDVVIGVWGDAQDCDAAAMLQALGALMPPPPPGTPGPFALSDPGALETLATSAGLTPVESVDVACPWRYPDIEILVRGMLSSGPAAKAIEVAGEDAARKTVIESVAAFRDDSGSYVLENVFRYLVTTA